MLKRFLEKIFNMNESGELIETENMNEVMENTIDEEEMEKIISLQTMNLMQKGYGI
ncbi:hypothetical protein ACFIJ5_14350 [Haloimpatiens sp. FM7330]|uniref:hypothetical protein n=1 Tax=Haloimpatiens sp. FM7330 TaxID=3298610 RepID=UPI0036270206